MSRHEHHSEYVSLTGRELRFAAAQGLLVRCVVKEPDPTDPNYNRVTRLTPAVTGFYVGPTDVDLSRYKDDERVEGFDDDGVFFGLYRVPGVSYASD